MQSHRAKNIRRTLLILCAMFAGLIGSMAILAILFGKGVPKPLTPMEAKFVGEWRQKATKSDDNDGNPFRFSSNRVFHTRDGEFKGRWWVANNQLHLKYWRDEESHVPFMELIRDYRTNVEVLNFEIDELNDQIRISEGESNQAYLWIRAKPDDSP